MDEPTAGLDPSLANRLLKAGGALLRNGRSVVLVTHQLSGLQDMDEILVLDRGCVVERGRWDELLAKQGFFYQMWALQQDVFVQSIGK
jgi:ABC-type multidrug transport system fused ATPase/permease subunit